jgi:hypothetical protein
VAEEVESSWQITNLPTTFPFQDNFRGFILSVDPAPIDKEVF